MAVKIADTLKALSNTFPVAECVDIDVNINGTTKRLQKAIDDGEIGGGSDSTWKGTHEEWEALSTEEKGKYEVICFTDDYDGSGSYSLWKGTREEWEALSPTDKEKYEIVYFTDDYNSSEIVGGYSIWKGTRDEWEALSTTDKQKYEIVCFTNDYNDNGIGESDSIWKGTRDEWDALLTAEKQKYVIVYFTDDYDGTGLIDDTNTSVKTTYSSSKIENSLSKKANTTDLTVHTSDTNIHVTTSDKTKWNNSVNKTDIIDNLTSTNTDKPLSANQGKSLNDKIGLKANATDLTSHTSDTNIHVTTSDKTKWNKVDNKVDKTDIIDNLTSTNTDKPLSANQGKVLKDEIYNKSKNRVIRIENDGDIIAYANSLGNEAVTETIRITNSINSPYGADNKENDFHYTIYNMYDSRFKRIVAYDIRKNDMYMIMKYGGRWRTWQRVCSTGVADVPKTNITLNNGFTGVAVSYEVKNGVCYVNIDALKSEKTGQDLIVSDTLLPKPSIGIITSTINFDRTDVKTGMVYIDTNSENKLRMHCYKANTDGWCTFSYPVAES